MSRRRFSEFQTFKADYPINATRHASGTLSSPNLHCKVCDNFIYYYYYLFHVYAYLRFGPAQAEPRVGSCDAGQGNDRVAPKGLWVEGREARRCPMVVCFSGRVYAWRRCLYAVVDARVGALEISLSSVSGHRAKSRGGQRACLMTAYDRRYQAGVLSEAFVYSGFLG